MTTSVSPGSIRASRHAATSCDTAATSTRAVRSASTTLCAEVAGTERVRHARQRVGEHLLVRHARIALLLALAEDGRAALVKRCMRRAKGGVSLQARPVAVSSALQVRGVAAEAAT